MNSVALNVTSRIAPVDTRFKDYIRLVLFNGVRARCKILEPVIAIDIGQNSFVDRVSTEVGTSDSDFVVVHITGVRTFFRVVHHDDLSRQSRQAGKANFDLRRNDMVAIRNFIVECYRFSIGIDLISRLIRQIDKFVDGQRLSGSNHVSVCCPDLSDFRQLSYRDLKRLAFKVVRCLDWHLLSGFPCQNAHPGIFGNGR